MTTAIDALRALAERWLARYREDAESADQWLAGYANAMNECRDDLRALLDSDAFRAMGRDAARLNWLRNGGWEVMQSTPLWPEHLKFNGAIDSAMATIGAREQT